MPLCPECGELLLDDRPHNCAGKLSPWPEQPDGIDEDSNTYPDPKRSAERINNWLEQWGDGLVDVINGAPLYARDLASLARFALSPGMRGSDE